MDENIISTYTAEQATDDGYIVPIFKNNWPTLTHGTPIYATRSVFDAISLAGLREIWNEYVAGAKTQEEKELFTTKMNSKEVWVCCDGLAYTIMYPEDY